MCVLIIAWRTFPKAPVVVAATRDEALARPFTPPQGLDPGVVAPQDLDAGGTWIGYNADDLFVGLVNRWAAGLAAERSRGLLVRDLLRASAAEQAARDVENAVRAQSYAGFNLVVADAEAALVLEWDGHLRVTPLEPGVHVVTNVGTDGRFFVPDWRPSDDPDLRPDRQADRARRLRAHLAPDPSEPADEWADRARKLLGSHEFGMCVHGDEYGTRSASLIRLELQGNPRYEFAPGPPCETPFTVVESQV